MVKLYRVEHSSDGCGPFTSKNEKGMNRIYSKRNYWKFVDRFGALPALWADHELKFDYDEMHMYKCAFQYTTEIKCYFPKQEIAELQRLGFEVVEVHVPHDKVKASDYQAIYKDADVQAKLVVTELFI